MRRNGFALLFLMAAIACGGSSSSGSDGTTPANDIPVAEGTIVLPDGAIVSDATPVDPGPPAECAKDEDCASKGEGYACNCYGRCIQPKSMADGGCFLDKNCGSSKYCEPCSKTCLDRLPQCAECTSDMQCSGTSAKCVSEFTMAGLTTTLPYSVCGQWCLLSTGVCTVAGAVPGTYTCASVGDPTYGVCVPLSLDCGDVAKRCTDDAECGEGEKCWQDLHVCGCKDTTYCEFGKACHPITHKCVPGCTTDIECGQKVCSMGLCQDPCHGSAAAGNVTGCPDDVPADAPPGSKWECEEGHCIIPGMCFAATDCREKETYCDAETKTCKTGCLIDYDCKQAAKFCDSVSKTCIEKGCIANYQCDCGKVCNLDTAKCEVAQGKYCEVCNQDDGEEACGDKNTLCVGFQDKDGNELGDFCMPPCSPDPDNPCPANWQCVEVKDSQGMSHGKKCIRHCYQEVMGGCAIGGGGTPTPEPTPDTATTSDP